MTIISPLLASGDRGEGTELLQRILEAEGFLDMTGRRGKIPYGIFARRTESALVHFQQTHLDPETGEPLEVTSVTDNATWRALRAPSGEPQRSHLQTTIPDGLTPHRTAVLDVALRFHGLDVREEPNGSNRGPHIDPLLPGWITKDPRRKGPPWCCFAVWALTYRALGHYPLGRSRACGSCYRTFKLAEKAGDWRLEPIPGDWFVMLYRDPTGRLTLRGHTGIVLRVSSTHINTLEGNSGNRFKLGRRRRRTIAGYVNHFGPGEQLQDFERGVVSANRVEGLGTR